jgi:hypothetical protein
MGQQKSNPCPSGSTPQYDAPAMDRRRNLRGVVSTVNIMAADGPSGREVAKTPQAATLDDSHKGG